MFNGQAELMPLVDGVAESLANSAFGKVLFLKLV